MRGEPRRRLPAGIRRRGAVFTYTWRDAAGRQYSRKGGDTLEQAEAFSAASTPSSRWPLPAGLAEDVRDLRASAPACLYL